VWLKKKLGVKLVYDAHEIFGYMIEGNISKFVVNYVFRMEKKLIKHVNHVITVNEPLKEYFEKITKAPITIVMNCKDPISENYKPPKSKVFTVSFISSLHRSRLLPEIIDTLGEIHNIRFVLAGKKEHIKLYHEVEKTSAKYENVEFLGTIPFDQVIPRTLEANAVINPWDPSMIKSKISTPNKLLEAMACGRPIICNKNTYAGKITEELNCGLVVDYDLEAIKEAVIKLRDSPELCERLGKNGLKKAVDEYNWDKQKIKLLKTYNRLK
jgi:glycosyltransferase involved in cell wall biosynthesis